MYSFMIIVNGMATRSVRHVICQKCLLPMTTYYAMLITLQWPLMNIISLCSILYVDIICVLLTSFHMYRRCVFLSKRCRIIPTSRRDIHNESLSHQWTLVIIQNGGLFPCIVSTSTYSFWITVMRLSVSPCLNSSVQCQSICRNLGSFFLINSGHLGCSRSPKRMLTRWRASRTIEFITILRRELEIRTNSLRWRHQNKSSTSWHIQIHNSIS